MDRIKLSFATILVAVMMQGCGGNKPSDLVENYIEAWNSGDVKKVIAYTNNELAESIQENIDVCVAKSMSDDVDKMYNAYKKETDKAWKEYNPILNNAVMRDKKKEFIQKIKVINEDSSLSSNQKMEKGGELFLSYHDSADKLKKTLSPNGYRFFVWFSFSKFLALEGVYREVQTDLLKQIVLEEIKGQNTDKVEKVQKDCQTEFFKVGEIKEFNIIEVKEISPDKQEVRVELMREKESDKQTIDVELINKEWRVITNLNHTRY